MSCPDTMLNPGLPPTRLLKAPNSGSCCQVDRFKFLMRMRRGKKLDSIRPRTFGSYKGAAGEVAPTTSTSSGVSLWLRKEHPDAEIVTELVQHDPQMAIFKATVTVPTGGRATGYGSETASDFPDFIEKAETKAIGRALNALGYGAQFGDFQRPTTLIGAVIRVARLAPATRPVALPRRDERPAKRPETKIQSAGEARP